MVEQEAMGQAADYLIVVDPRSAALDALGVVVGHVASDRLGVVHADGATLERLRRRAGVVAVGQVLPAAVTAQLDESERLFVDAWSLRAEPKERRGDGLNWDAAGFEPPDA